MQVKTFYLDSLGDTPIQGYDTGEDWNGWACPLFSFEQAQALVSSWKAQGWEAHYNSAKDAFVFSVNQDLKTGHSDQFETVHAVEYEGGKYYPVGSGSWIWDMEE